MVEYTPHRVAAYSRAHSSDGENGLVHFSLTGVERTARPTLYQSPHTLTVGEGGRKDTRGVGRHTHVQHDGGGVAPTGTRSRSISSPRVCLRLPYTYKNDYLQIVLVLSNRSHSLTRHLTDIYDVWCPPFTHLYTLPEGQPFWFVTRAVRLVFRRPLRVIATRLSRGVRSVQPRLYCYTRTFFACRSAPRLLFWSAKEGTVRAPHGVICPNDLLTTAVGAPAVRIANHA